MATDDKDVDTEVESAETLTDSSPEEKTQVEESEKDDSKVVEKPDDETLATWESLKGKTQERIITLIRKNKQLQTSLEAERTQRPSQPQRETPADLSEGEIKDAVGKLRKYGVATQDDLRAIEDRLLLDAEHSRLKNKYSGESGEPKYTPEEVEEYARSHYFGGNLEAAFKDMYFDEFVDAESKKRGKKEQTFTEKPTASVKIGERPLTVESLRERLKQPDGAEWWVKNREKIEPLLEKLSQR